MEEHDSVKWKSKHKCPQCGQVLYDRSDFADTPHGHWFYATYNQDYSRYVDSEMAEEKPSVYDGEVHPDMPKSLHTALAWEKGDTFYNV